MNKKSTDIAALCIVIILVAFFIATTPFVRSLNNKEYTPLELYPTYYYADFKVRSTDFNAELLIDLRIDFGGNYGSCVTLWALYKLPQVQFEEIFNVTEVSEAMKRNDWKPADFGAIWGGWFAGSHSFLTWEPVNASDYVFAFFTQYNESATDWSATLSVSLRTRLLLIPGMQSH